jgi:WD40 repeat protein
MKLLKDGKRLVTGSPDFSISVTDLSSKADKPITTVTEHKYKIFSVDVSDDEKLMASSGSGCEIIFWDFNSMSVLKKEKANAFIVYNTKFIAGSNYIAAGDSKG